jgi:hypothetical protein
MEEVAIMDCGEGTIWSHTFGFEANRALEFDNDDEVWFSDDEVSEMHLFLKLCPIVNCKTMMLPSRIEVSTRMIQNKGGSIPTCLMTSTIIMRNESEVDGVEKWANRTEAIRIIMLTT